MKPLYIFVEKEGEEILTGRITGDNTDSACFIYDDIYAEKTGIPLSVSLPLEKKRFSPEETRNFFDGLLPEGFTRRSVAGSMHVTEENYIGILAQLGQECLGAIRVSGNEEDNTVSGYQPVNKDEIMALASEGASYASDIVIRSHLSLTGATGKVGLYYDQKNNRWYKPLGNAPSTYIVKQSHVRLDSIVTNEQLCMMTARKCGIKVPDSSIISFGTKKDSEVLFAARRYDRVFSENNKFIDGLPRPERLHQEDFSQALGIRASNKYENSRSGYLAKMFDLIRKVSADPIRDNLELWSRIVFNLLIGNTDAHIKNYSLLYSADLRRIRLAPAYDVLSTLVYDSGTPETSMFIGNRNNIFELERKDIEKAAEEAGIGNVMALKQLSRINTVFEDALRSSSEKLTERGFVHAAKLRDKILENRRKLRFL